MHRVCALFAATEGASLGIGPGEAARQETAQFEVQQGVDFPHGARMFGAFHRQLPLFRGVVHDSQRKYNILWFVVDLHHRERYFFICGCNQIVTRLQPERLERA